MRQSIFEAIESSDDKPKPKLTDENLIINELIREYFIYNIYLHTNRVFLSESVFFISLFFVFFKFFSNSNLCFKKEQFIVLIHKK